MDELLNYISLYRVVWLGGRMGFGKTAFACILAEQMLLKGLADGVITNFPSVYPAHYQEDDGTLRNRVIVYDEAWVDLDSRSSMTNERAYGAYARKFGCYWLFPSVHPIDKRLRAVEIKPAYKNIITGSTVWKYTVKDDEKKPTVGTVSMDTKRAYGRYSTSYIPVGDCGISKRFEVTYYEETGERYNPAGYNNRAVAADSEG